MAEPEVLAVPSAHAEPEAAPHVSLVVPIYNEQASVDELYRRTIDTLEAADLTFEVIFVDDGSTDETFAKLEGLHDADQRVRVVRFKRNFAIAVTQRHRCQIVRHHGHQFGSERVDIIFTIHECLHHKYDRLRR